MPLPSSLTAYVPIPENSDGTPGLWDTRFQAAFANASQVNSDAAASVATLFAPSGNTISDGTYSHSGSTLSFLGALVPVVSVGTIQAFSGNTVFISSHLSLGNKRIERLGEPSGASDAATKNYVDFLATGGLSNFIGSWMTVVTDRALSSRSVAYITSTSSLSMADSTVSTKCPAGNIFVTLASSGASSITTIALPGAAIGGYLSLVTGTLYFVNTTGGPTATMPSGQSTIVYSLGVAASAGTIMFTPQYWGSNAT